MKLQVLGRVIIAEPRGFVQIVRDIDNSVIAPRQAGDLSRGKRFQLAG
jgi:hypothetical protein